MWTKTMRRDLAIFLWAAVSVVLGLSLGLSFHFTPPKILFLIVVSTGLYALAILRWSRPKPTQSPRRPAALNNHDQWQTRRWLDDFLRQQQED